MDARMRIDTGAFSGRIGAGCDRWRSSRATGILATIFFPYDWPSSSGLFMGVMLCMYVYGYDCRYQFQTDVCVRLGGRKDIKQALYLNKWNVYAPAARLMREVRHAESKISECWTKQESRGRCEKSSGTK